MVVDSMSQKEDNKRRTVEMVFFDGELEKVLEDIGVPITDFNKKILLFEFRNRMYDAIRGRMEDVKTELKEDIAKGMTDFDLEG